MVVHGARDGHRIGRRLGLLVVLAQAPAEVLLHHGVAGGGGCGEAGQRSVRALGTEDPCHHPPWLGTRPGLFSEPVTWQGAGLGQVGVQRDNMVLIVVDLVPTTVSSLEASSLCPTQARHDACALKKTHFFNLNKI